jgi:Phosphotransferase enzyme family
MDVPTERALRAVAAVARNHGLPVDRMRVVRDLTNVLVHLEPAPVVARVPITLARFRDRDWFAQVVALARFLVDAGAPVAPPTDEADPGPHEHDGLLLELWTHVDHDPERFDPAAAGRSLRDLHEALATYPDPLPTFDRLDEVGRLLPSLAISDDVSADDLAALREAHARLSAEPVPQGTPLHGDAHLRNILWSSSGPLWSDLENVCAGPVEYDLAAVIWRRQEGMHEALAAYGAYDAEVVERVTPFLAVFLAAWTIRVVERDRGSAGGRAELRRRLDWVRSWLV